jgi:organic radical activating enzyme
MNKGYINEIFVSYQGEGVYLGLKQVFVRFSGCNLRCSYCDTLHALERSDRFEIVDSYGKMNFRDNPITTKDLIKHIAKFGRNIHSVSITGGEPLCQPGFVKELAVRLKKERYKVYLDTNGVLYKEIESIIKYVDIVSADIKLPSVTGLKPYFEEHRKFLKACGKKVFVKIVIGRNTSSQEVEEALSIVRKINRKMTVVFQPEYRSKIDQIFQKIDTWKDTMDISDIRVIPQMHRLAGIK